MGSFTHLFPLSVYRDRVVLDASYQQSLVEHVMRMEAETAARATSHSAWLGDTRGFEFLFQLEAFQPLFQQIGKLVREYTASLGFDTNLIDFYFQRAWATVTRKGEHISDHSHEQSNISVAYYLKKPSQSGAINFMTESHPNEFSRGILSPSKAALGFIRQPSMLTWNAVSIDAAEGEILIFPSKTLHSTTPSESDDVRISLSADITTLLKDSRGHETMMPHFSQWRRFEL